MASQGLHPTALSREDIAGRWPSFGPRFVCCLETARRKQGCGVSSRRRAVAR